MSQKAPWLVLSALVLIAAALFVMLRGGGDGPVPGRPGGSDAPAPVGSGQPLVSEAPVGSPESAAPTGAERQQLTEPRAGAAGLVAVTGRLVLADGGPAAGREVALSSVRRLQGVRRLPADPPDARQAPAETTTDASGQFSYLVEPGQGGELRLPEQEWVLVDGVATFEGSAQDIDLGDLTIGSAAVLAGVVVDAAGQPVAEVQVQAGRGRALALLAGGGRNVARTDDRGRFRFPGLAPGEYRLRTASPGFLPHSSDLALALGERREDLRLELERGQAIAGQAVDDLGRPLPDINVAARRRSTPAAGVTLDRFTPAEATRTDENGLFTLAGLEGQEATVRAWGEGYAEAVESDVAIGTSNLVMQMQRLAVIAGVLVDERGVPISGSRVRASAGRGIAGLDLDLEVPRMAQVAGMATTADDGTFRIEGVTPGTVTVRASGESHRPAELTGVVVDPGSVTEGVRVIANRGAMVVVEVVDTEGQPVAEADVEVLRAQEIQEITPGAPNLSVERNVRVARRGGERTIISSGNERVLGRGRTNEEGRVVISGLPPGNAEVTATQQDLVAADPTRIALPVTGAVDARVTVSPGGYAALTIVDAAGEPLSNARYTVRGRPGEEHPGQADARGAARVGPLVPGRYSAMIELQPGGRTMGSGVFVTAGSRRVLTESRVRFDIVAGEDTAVELVKPVLTTFSGTVFDSSGPVAGATVQLMPKAPPESGGARSVRVGGRDGARAVTDPDGSFEMSDVSAGTYTVEYGRPEQLVKAETEVEFAAGQAEARQDLRLSGGTVQVTVLSADRNGPLSGAEVEIIRPTDTGQSERGMFMMAVNVENEGQGETMTMQVGGASVVTGADGVAVIDAVPPGEYSLRVRHRDHVRETLPELSVLDGQVTDAGTVSMRLGGGLTGRIYNPSGPDLPVTLVEYWQVIAGDESEHERIMARNGRFELSGLAPGTYKFRTRDILAAGGALDRWGPEKEVEVLVGETATVRVSLPVMH